MPLLTELAEIRSHREVQSISIRFRVGYNLEQREVRCQLIDETLLSCLRAIAHVLPFIDFSY